MKKLTVVFMGSGSFGIPSLQHLLGRPDIDLRVVTQPDRPAGRGRHDRPTPVAEAVGSRAPLKKIQNVNDSAVVDDLRREGMDLLLVCDFGQILKLPLLALSRIGPFNLHGSILPAYRGAAPIQRALLDGVAVTGVTLLRVNERCDAGPIVSWAESPVGPDESFGVVHDRLSRMAVGLLEPFLGQCASGHLPEEHPQDESHATPAPKIKKDELHLQFDRPAEKVHRRIMAFSPTPGAYAVHSGARVKLLKSSVCRDAGRASAGAAQPGTVGVTPDRRCLTVSCAGSTFLEILEIQPEGGRVQTALEMLNGYPGILGAKLS